MLYPAFWWFVGRPKAVDRGSLLEMDNIGYILSGAREGVLCRGCCVCVGGGGVVNFCV